MWQMCVFQTPFEPLSGFKNPCWISNITDADPYKFSLRRYRLQIGPRPGRGLRDFGVLTERYKAQMRRIYEIRTDTWRLRCFPYAMLIGVSKSGTSDLFSRVVAGHPHIYPPATKELWFWGRYRLQMECKYDYIISKKFLYLFVAVFSCSSFYFTFFAGLLFFCSLVSISITYITHL